MSRLAGLSAPQLARNAWCLSAAGRQLLVLPLTLKPRLAVCSQPLSTNAKHALLGSQLIRYKREATFNHLASATNFQLRGNQSVRPIHVANSLSIGDGGAMCFEAPGSVEDIVSRHAKAGEETSGIPSKREDYNKCQEQFFDDNVDYFAKPVPAEVEEKLAQVVSAARVGPESAVLDCGAGAGALTHHLHNAGVTDVTAVDLSLMMMAELKARFDDVRCWHGDIVDMPSEEFGPFDAVFFNAMFANVHSQAAALHAAVGLLKPGGRIVISHPLGAKFVAKLKKESPHVVPHSMPDKELLRELITSLPLEVTELRDDEAVYLAVLTVKSSACDGDSEHVNGINKEEYFFRKAPLFLEGPVVAGFGRGSKQMGVPTANMPPEQLEDELEGVEKGVYFGLAQVPELDPRVLKMVMNVGQRPTFVDGDGLSVEVHILHKFADDFYGKYMRVAVLGFIRPEMKFSSLDELVTRIHNDVNIASTELEKSKWQQHYEVPLFRC